MTPTQTLHNTSTQTNQRVVLSWLADTQTPATLFQQLLSLENKPSEAMGFLLESADGDKRLARFSMLGVTPKLIAKLKQGQWEITDTETNESRTTDIGNEHPFQTLKALQETQLPHQELSVEVPFSGGWAGYWGYGVTQYFERIPQQTLDPLDMPDVFVGLYDTVLVFDHLYRQLHLIGIPDTPRFQKILNYLNSKNQIQHPGLLALPAPELKTMSLEAAFKNVNASMSKQDYMDKVLKAKQWIKEGQVFQIVVTQRFSTDFTQHPLDAYRLLQALNPSPYAYYLQFPNTVYFGASPETCVSHQNSLVTLRALAGTRHRGQTPTEDAALAEELKANAKEMAEHRMLVDLARNDLGRVSAPGTVKAKEIAQLVYYTHVMHLSTEVTGQLSPQKTPYDVLASCFPRGTVSGAPKIRAMQLLSDLEPERRGVYSGMVGYLDTSGNLDTAIAIRSTLIKDGVAHVQAGAGIVFDSEPEAEYEETRNKARSILTALQLTKQLSVSSEATLKG